jgi:hypothetical protein
MNDDLSILNIKKTTIFIGLLNGFKEGIFIFHRIYYINNILKFYQSLFVN